MIPAPDDPLHSDAFACLGCSSELSLDDAETRLCCPACGMSWPVEDGIPRFVQPARYWGEIPEGEAEALSREARQSGWRAAVVRRFSSDREMQISILDWQRASWMSLLRLPPDAVALDVGCGNGAITHCLARGVRQVFALEAVPLRIEFTRTRLEQDGISNVQLVQASAIDPPFRRQLFDLIVVNGVLEWVGEWCLGGKPRDVQVRFLQRLRRMLKPEGVLYTGIENRVGVAALLGGVDHSGLPYTSLMPRFAATWFLRHSRKGHHRTELNPRLEYRTYTYSEAGLRRLLSDGGFPESQFFWADPGYNQPYHLVPLDRALIAERARTALTEPGLISVSRPKQWVKRLAAASGLLRFAVSEFVVLAQPQPAGLRLWKALREAVPGLPDLRCPALALSTSSFGLKNVIAACESGCPVPRCILKTTTLAPGSEEAFRRALQGLRLINTALEEQKAAGFSVPRLIGEAQIGPFLYAAETAAAGEALARLAFRRRTARHLRSTLEEHMPRAIRVAVSIATLLRGRAADLPAVCHGEAPGGAGLADAVRRRGSPASDWVQHGDFTIENILLDAGGRISVLDWEHAFRGGTPLHDIFTLLISALPAVEASLPQGPGAWAEQFETAFFGSGFWGRKTREWLSDACRQLGIPASETWPMFIEFLLHQYHHRSGMGLHGAPQAQLYDSFLRIAAAKGGRFVVQ